MQFFGYFGNGRQLLPIIVFMYNKFVGRLPVLVSRGVRAASVCVNQGRSHIGEVVRYEARTFMNNLEGRKSNAFGSSMRVFGDRHVGGNYYAPGCVFSPPRCTSMCASSILTHVSQSGVQLVLLFSIRLRGPGVQIRQIVLPAHYLQSVVIGLMCE